MEPTMTGVPVVDSLIKLLGAVYLLMSALAVVLPRQWALTLWLARHASDLRGLRVPGGPADGK